MARFNEGVEDIADLREGMVLEGTVSNVAAFGAFVDLGVHQDGLVHVSQLSHKFVKDAREVVKTGDIVKVKVMEVDVARKRIALSMKLGDAPTRRDGPRDNRFEGAAAQRARPRSQPAQHGDGGGLRQAPGPQEIRFTSTRPGFAANPAPRRWRRAPLQIKAMMGPEVGWKPHAGDAPHGHRRRPFRTCTP